MSEFTQAAGWYVENKRGDKGWLDKVKAMWQRPSFTTAKPLSWDVGTKGSGLTVTVPKGYSFDFSAPRVVWPFLSPRDPRFLKAACLHDYLLHERGWTRVSAAAAFSDALRASMPERKILRLFMVFAVITWKWS